MKSKQRPSVSARNHSKQRTTQSRSKKVQPADKRRANTATTDKPQSAERNELAQRIIAAMSKRHTADEVSTAAQANLPVGNDRETIRTALAVILEIPKSRVTNALLNKLIRKMRADAEKDAALVGNYLDQRVDHLTSIRCTTGGEIDKYLEAEDQVLCELYTELRRAQPSPTRLLQLSVRYALDARQTVDVPIQNIDVRPHKHGYEIAVHPPGRVKIRSLPYPGVVVRNPYAIQLLNFVRQAPPPYFQMMRLIETLLQHLPSFPERLEPPASKPISPIEVDLDQSVVLLLGQYYKVSSDAARFVKKLIDDPNGWVSTKEFNRDADVKITRCDRLFQSLPQPIRDLIDSKPGAGYRLNKKRLAQLCQQMSVVPPSKVADDS